MAERKIDLVVVTMAEHVQWLAGPRYDFKFSPIAALTAEGQLTLVAPGRKGKPLEIAAAADEIVPYEAQWLSTLRNDQRAAAAAVLLKTLSGKSKPRRVGVEFSSCGPHLSQQFQQMGAELFDIEPQLYTFRRRKDPDELARLKKAIAGTGRMYELARQIVRPGVNELDVFNQLQAVAVRDYGECSPGRATITPVAPGEVRPAIASRRRANCTCSIWGRRFAVISPTTVARSPSMENRPTLNCRPGNRL